MGTCAGVCHVGAHNKLVLGTSSGHIWVRLHFGSLEEAHRSLGFDHGRPQKRLVRESAENGRPRPGFGHVHWCWLWVWRWSHPRCQLQRPEQRQKQRDLVRIRALGAHMDPPPRQTPGAWPVVGRSSVSAFGQSCPGETPRSPTTQTGHPSASKKAFARIGVPPSRADIWRTRCRRPDPRRGTSWLK